MGSPPMASAICLSDQALPSSLQATPRTLFRNNNDKISTHTPFAALEQRKRLTSVNQSLA